MVPVLVGRGFDERDVSENRNVMVVNDTFAKHYFEARTRSDAEFDCRKASTT